MKNDLIHGAARHDTEQLTAKQAVKRTLALAFMMAMTSFSAVAAPTPSARQILESARFQQAQQKMDLQGQIRQEALVVPFRITQDGAVIRYSFANPPGALLLHLDDKDSRLEELGPGKVDKISPAELSRPVRGTAITYEDLSLKFLYWPNAKVIGEETVQTRRCWKLLLTAPSAQSQYGKVLLWVDEGGNALMQMEGYNAKGQLLKRFEVISAQKIEGRWFLKQMRVETFKPGTNEVTARAYLEIKK